MVITSFFDMGISMCEYVNMKRSCFLDIAS